jgi:divalent metal cation (Fe/Co/Zn/Cd) transporter
MSATRSAVIRSLGLLGVKVGAFLLTGSAVLLAGMVDSLVDVAASLIAYMVKPKEHHVEHQLALIQAFWICAGGLLVLVESIRGLHEPVEMATTGVAILVLTLTVDGTIVRKLAKDANPVVQGLAEDIKADMTNSVGGLVALVAIALGAPMMVDKLVAIVISVFLIVKGAKLFDEHMIEASTDHAHEHVDEVEGVGAAYV